MHRSQQIISKQKNYFHDGNMYCSYTYSKYMKTFGNKCGWSHQIHFKLTARPNPFINNLLQAINTIALRKVLIKWIFSGCWSRNHPVLFLQDNPQTPRLQLNPHLMVRFSLMLDGICVRDRNMSSEFICSIFTHCLFCILHWRAIGHFVGTTLFFFY